MADVSTPIKLQTSMVDKARPVRTLVAGTEAMRKAREQYLPREEAESESSYDKRLARTFLFNATGKTIEDLTGRVFIKPITFEKDVPQQLKDWAENIDNAGRHLNVFARDAFIDAMQPGVGYIFVDAPPPPVRQDGAVPTLADYQTAKWRPYCTYIPVENLLGWKTTVDDGAVKLTQIRIKECVTEPDGEWGEKEIEQIRVVSLNGLGTGCVWQTFRKPDASDQWVENATGTISLPAIPLVPIYIKWTGFMTGEPPHAKLAELNIAHWQSSSDQRNIVHTARVPILFYAGASQDAKLTIGAGSAVFNSDPQAKLTYVEHTGAAIGAGDKDLENLTLQMQAMGLQMLVDKPGQTATGEVRDDAKENSPLAMAATALQDALETAFGYMAQFAGLPFTAGGSIAVNKDFGIGKSGSTDLQQLLASRIAGEISRETFWSEMQRRGFLSDSFDPDVEKDRLETEETAAMNAAMNLEETNGGPDAVKVGPTGRAGITTDPGKKPAAAAPAPAA